MAIGLPVRERPKTDDDEVVSTLERAYAQRAPGFEADPYDPEAYMYYSEALSTLGRRGVRRAVKELLEK